VSNTFWPAGPGFDSLASMAKHRNQAMILAVFFVAATSKIIGIGDWEATEGGFMIGLAGFADSVA